MGACDDSIELDGTLSESEVKSRFRAYQDECASESGNSYSGRLNMCPGITFARVDTFKSHDEAYEYLNKTAQKWENAIAVRYLASNKIKTDDARLVKLRQSVRTCQDALHAFDRELSSSVDTRLKSVEFIKCGACKSRLDTRFRVRTLRCPVCESSFASKTELKKRDTLKSKLKNAETKLGEHLQKLQAKADAKNRVTRWIVYGVCSS